ncbi:acyltransferase [Cryobacterium sp. TMT2-10]|uniref:acyltransferase family protein n=1 Tax=Cryobacterium sp. TMT2-10 TaxID=1259244 RepID=UPI00106B29DC|nr:acyltransferase [Cryobacterium sp. TMT2-10]
MPSRVYFVRVRGRPRLSVLPNRMFDMGDKLLRPERGENSALNAVRAAAAFLVVAGHARGFLFVGREDASGDLLTQGALALFGLGHGAVLVFFVLSGYFVGGSVQRSMTRGTFSVTSYAISRLTRLWIVLIPAILLTAILDWMGRARFGATVFYGEESNAFTNSGWLTALGNISFMQPLHVRTFGSNEALWSLTYEAGYYVIFPLLLAGFFYARRLRVKVLLAAVGLGVIATFGWSVLSLFPVWLLGAAVAFRGGSIRSRVSKVPPMVLTALRVLNLLALVGAMVADKVAGGSPVNAPFTSYIVGVLAASFVALLLPDLWPRQAAGRQLLRLSSGLAASSYSLYAIHYPLLVLMAVAVSPGGVTGSWQPSVGSWAGFIAIVVALTTAGWVFSLVTERHTESARRRVAALLTVPFRSGAFKRVAGHLWSGRQSAN